MKKGMGGPPRISGTALAQYQRLETTGLWRDRPGAGRREVIVRMGEATLTLLDPRDEQALSHWSLPAVRRLNPGQKPALFSPAADSAESVEISDDTMIAALKKVARAVNASHGRGARWRGIFALVIAVIIIVTGLWLGRGFLVSHTADLISPPRRAEIGQQALVDASRLAGPPCNDERGRRALAKLSAHLFGTKDAPAIYILPGESSRPVSLPGRIILLPRSLIEQDSPEALAGAVLVQDLAAQAEDPLLALLRHGGIIATFNLLTSGKLPQETFDGYIVHQMNKPEVQIPHETIVETFKEARIPLAPYARWAHSPDEATLVAADSHRDLATSPLLSDDDWIAIQSVCSPN